MANDPRKRLSPRMRLTNDKMDSDAELYRRVAQYMAGQAAKLEKCRPFLANLEAMAQHWLETADYGSRPFLFEVSDRFIDDITREPATPAPTPVPAPAKITAARITRMPRSLFDPMPEVYVTVDGQEQFLFKYYPDEISFTATEFIGLTLDEARDLHRRRDTAYLRF